MRRARQLKRRTSPAFLLVLLLGLVALLSPSRALAGDKDADGLVAVADALGSFVDGKMDEAAQKLQEAIQVCAGKACEPTTRAQLYIAQGIVQGAGDKDLVKARASFEAALKEDPKVVPDRQFMTQGLQKVFNDAKTDMKKGPAAPAPTRPLPTRQNLDGVQAAQAQLNTGDWSNCMGTAIATMADHEFAAGKLILATCEDRGNLLLEASSDARLAAKYADGEVNADVARRAKDLITKLDNDIPTISVVVPKSIDSQQVFIDGVLVPKEKAEKPIPHNPGKVTVEVKGKKGPYPIKPFKEDVPLDRGDRATVNVKSDTNDSVVQLCIESARSAADVNRCIESGGKGRGLTLRGGLEVATFNDTFNVDVFSPTLFFSAENPTSGWRVGGSYTVDVVSNASPDIVATASPRYNEVRNAATLAGEYKFGLVRAGIDGGVSVEPDYVGRSVGAALSADLDNKMVTPTLAFHVGDDTLGRAGTPFSVFSRTLNSYSIDAGASIIKDASTIFVLGGTAEFDLGDSSKPYRHVPMFASSIAPSIPVGATANLVNATRLALAPLEQVPDSRNRLAGIFRAAHRWETVTLRGDERLYIDSWGLKASTTDARLLVDATKSLRIGPHARFHVQGPVDFWQLAYVGALTPGGVQLPQYRTADRELGPLWGVTLGGSARYALSEIFAVSVQVEGLYTQYTDDLYFTDRLGLLTTTTLDIGVE